MRIFEDHLVLGEHLKALLRIRLVIKVVALALVLLHAATSLSLVIMIPIFISRFEHICLELQNRLHHLLFFPEIILDVSFWEEFRSHCIVLFHIFFFLLIIIGLLSLELRPAVSVAAFEPVGTCFPSAPEFADDGLILANIGSCDTRCIFS